MVQLFRANILIFLTIFVQNGEVKILKFVESLITSLLNINKITNLKQTSTILSYSGIWLFVGHLSLYTFLILITG